MANFGNPQGPLVPLGTFAVVAGTVQPLSTNRSLDGGFGTPAGGLAPLTTVGHPAPITASRIVITTPGANTGLVFLVFKAQPAATAPGTSVILGVNPGQTVTLETRNQSGSPLPLDALGLDSSTATQNCWVTAVLG